MKNVDRLFCGKNKIEKGRKVEMKKEAAENERKKEYLKGYEREIRKMERCKIKIEEMRLQQIYPSVSSDGMPHAHIKNDLSSFVSLLDQEERRYQKANYLRVKKCKEITDKIERLEKEDEKDVLMYRYIRLMKWEDIAIQMGYSWQHLHKIHAKALKNFRI